MTCLANESYLRGGVDDLVATIVAHVPLDAQPVYFSWDHGDTWTEAAWVGDVGTTRDAVLSVDFSDLYVGTYKLIASVGVPESSPWFEIGEFTVEPA